ncbi:MAG TPA: hypothetical protein VFE05_11600 [Longimicrobiaceae bacterium]|jgi:hypothetical protein|nr:hypothetical protein [Longimicrobiaceae bacterium]
MMKLTVEDLTVTSFEVSAAALVPQPSLIGPCYPTDPNAECTFGCSHDTRCPDRCIIIVP